LTYGWVVRTYRCTTQQPSGRARSGDLVVRLEEQVLRFVDAGVDPEDDAHRAVVAPHARGSLDLGSRDGDAPIVHALVLAALARACLHSGSTGGHTADELAEDGVGALVRSALDQQHDERRYGAGAVRPRRDVQVGALAVLDHLL